MSKNITPLVAAAALALMSLPSFAASTTAASTSTKAAPASSTSTHAKAAAKAAVGEITALDATGNNLTVKVRTKTEEFSLAPTAMVTVAGKPAKLSDLKVGQKVEVRYEMQGTNMLATHVTRLGHA